MHLPVLLALHPPAAERVKSSPKQKLPKKNRTTTRCSYNRLVCNCCAYASTRSLLSIIVTHIEPQTHRTNKPLNKGGARLCSDTFCWHVTSGVSFEARNLLVYLLGQNEMVGFGKVLAERFPHRSIARRLLGL